MLIRGASSTEAKQKWLLLLSSGITTKKIKPCTILTVFLLRQVTTLQVFQFPVLINPKYFILLPSKVRASTDHFWGVTLKPPIEVALQLFIHSLHFGRNYLYFMTLAFLFGVFYSTHLINLILVDRTGFLVVYWKQGKVKPLHFPLSLIILNIKWVHYPLNVWTNCFFFLKKKYLFLCACMDSL